jgi:mannitol/fructose-specific phosphotransferase system IIA component (Ntr-type)
MNRIQFVGNALFIPFFLISVGMLVDVSVLVQGQVWYKALMFALLVYAGKGLAALISKLIYNYTPAEGWTIFGLSTPQAAATLAVTLIGFEVGLFTDVAVNAVVILILITCLTGPWLVEQYGRTVALQDAQKKYKATDAPQRILVPLANPGTAEALMDIAFAMRDKNSSQSVFPLTVVRDGPNVASSVADSEKMLSHAVIYAAGADVPVSPLTRIDMNISNGITRAIREKRITNVIIGWNGESSARQQVFGGVLDQLLEQSKEMIMVCKIEDKISTNEHIVLAIPPFAALEQGFPEAMRYLKILANQIGAVISVIVVEERLEFVKNIFMKTEPEVVVKWIGIPSWSKLISKIDDVLDSNDMLVLHSSREGTISWRPGLDRLPGIFANRYPSNTFLAIYPSEISELTPDDLNDKKNGNAQSIIDMIGEENIYLELKNDSTRELIRTMIGHSLASNELSLDEACEAILDNSLEYTPEIIPGAAILDAHTPGVSKTRIYIGISQDGVKIPKASGPVHILVLVINPDSLGIDGHFSRLNQIAKLFRNSIIVESLIKASSKAAVFDILKMVSSETSNNKTVNKTEERE